MGKKLTHNCVSEMSVVRKEGFKNIGTMIASGDGRTLERDCTSYGINGVFKGYKGFSPEKETH